MSHSIDPSLCPICGKPNQCGAENPAYKINGQCWCVSEAIPRGIFSLVPEDKLNKACICRICLNEYRRNEP
ncbi:cysteine-rich CWC family protein [bacterium]|nr:cysteine-rich CWC family protein [bacterium]